MINDFHAVVDHLLERFNVYKVSNTQNMLLVYSYDLCFPVRDVLFSNFSIFFQRMVTRIKSLRLQIELA